MKAAIAIVALLAAFSASAQHVDVRVGGNSQAISVSTAPIYKWGDLSANIEGGVQRWKANDVVGTQLYVTPAFQWAVTKSVAIEAGIGVSVFDRTQFGDKSISTRFQFADHLGVRYATKSFTVGLRYVHASNGGIKKPNPGLDSVQATISAGF